MEVGGQLHALVALISSTHQIGYWLGTRVGLDAMELRNGPYICWEMNPAVQTVEFRK
jgi:hypothetical protein